VVEAQRRTVLLGLTASTALKEGTASLREQTTATSNNLIGVVGLPLVADVIEPSDLHAIACALPRVGAWAASAAAATPSNKERANH
jgi:hypothetical protein